MQFRKGTERKFSDNMHRSSPKKNCPNCSSWLTKKTARSSHKRIPPKAAKYRCTPHQKRSKRKIRPGSCPEKDSNSTPAKQSGRERFDARQHTHALPPLG